MKKEPGHYLCGLKLKWQITVHKNNGQLIRTFRYGRPLELACKSEGVKLAIGDYLLCQSL